MNRDMSSKLNNDTDFDLPENGTFYFIGIGGVGMSAIAMLLKNTGSVVSGSELIANVATKILEDAGINICYEQNGRSIDKSFDLIVISAAIPESNHDLSKARELGIKVIKYSEVLGLLMKRKRGIAVSGTHGKTTTAAMISTVLKAAGFDPASVIGGDLSEFEKDFCAGKGEYLVAEACEYDRTFLRLFPQIGIITNIDEDHLDYYKDIDVLRSAFAEFASSVSHDGMLVINGQDHNIKEALGDLNCKVESYAIDSSLPVSTRHKWIATKPLWRNNQNCFNVYCSGKFYGKFTLIVPGVHNVMNALASIVVCSHLGVGNDVIIKALSAYKGVDRRFQVLGTVNGITVIDDYAHHPTAIHATLGVARETFPGRRIWCLYQPHQFSRTKLLLDMFVNSFDNADKITFAEIYPARDSVADKKSVSSADVVFKMEEIGLDAEFIPDNQEIIDMLSAKLTDGDVLITMGAGDVWQIAYKVLNSLMQLNTDNDGYKPEKRETENGLSKFSINSGNTVSSFFLNLSNNLAFLQS